MPKRCRSRICIRKKLVLCFVYTACTTICTPLHLHAQDETQKKRLGKNRETQTPAKGVPVDVRVKRVTLRYGSEVSFYMPDGEFTAFFRNKFGYFSTITQARYNFLRGEIEFKNETLFAKYKIAPQLAVFDRLSFVPLFEQDKIWRREQAMQVGVLFFVHQPFKTLTSFSFTRYSYPSLSEPQNLESYQALAFSQAFGAEADSIRILGMLLRGAIDIQLDKAFPYANSSANFWQLHIRGWHTFEIPCFSITSEFDHVALLKGYNPPLRFLGGLDKLSLYKTNGISGYDLSYLSIKTQIHIMRKNKIFFRNWRTSQTDFVLHFEAGRLKGEKNQNGLQAFHTSLGIGLQMECKFGDYSLFDVFFIAYNNLHFSRKPRFYFGIKR